MVGDLRGSRLATNAARDVLRDQLVALAWRVRAERSDVSPEQQFQFTDDLRTQVRFKKYLDRLWPLLAAGPLVRTLFTNQGERARCAEGVLSKAEQDLLARRSTPKIADERWTRADLGLLDEVHARAVGDQPQFGHVVVDEAQDLSAMELRMVARRAYARSMTILSECE